VAEEPSPDGRETVKEMALTWPELQRAIPSIAAGAAYRIGEHCVSLRLGAGEMVILFESRPPRKLGCLRIPVAQLSLRGEGLSESDRQAFLRRFDRVLQRGGG
jgi:hypothetical protein